MYGNVKNMANYLAKSETLRNIAVPKDRYENSVHIVTRIRRAYFRGVTSYRGGLLAKIREGFASFVTYITKLSDQCQKTLKVELRRKASRLPYSLRNRLHLLISYQSHSLSKKLANLFAELKTLCIFVSANVLNKVHKTYLTRIIAGFSGLFHSLVQCVCQNTREPRSFCIHITTNFCYLWQTLTKVSTRSTVRSLHLVPMVRNHSSSLPKPSLSNSSKVILPNLSRQKGYTVAPYPCSVSGAMMSLKATTHRCTNSLQSSML